MPRSPKIPGAANTEGAPEFTRELPVELSSEELQKTARKAGKLQRQVDEFNTALRARIKEEKQQIKDAEGELRTCLKTLDTGTEDRKIKCFERKDFNAGKVSVIRTDTGAVVETRPMTAEERQETFPALGGNGKAKRGPGRPRKEAKDPRFQDAVNASGAPEGLA